MRRILGSFVMAIVLTVPGVSSAADPAGIYVAPKFVYGLTQMDGVKGHASLGGESDSIRIGSKTDSAFGGSLAVGYDFEKKFGVPVRAEIEYAGFSKTEAKRSWEETTIKQSFTVQTLFLNAYYDINTGTALTPYVGAGIGAGFIRTRGTLDFEGLGGVSTGNRTVTNFAWNLGAGVGYDINEYMTVDLGYRFVGLGSVKTGSVTLDAGGEDLRLHAKAENLYQHQVAMGIRITF